MPVPSSAPGLQKAGQGLRNELGTAQLDLACVQFQAVLALTMFPCSLFVPRRQIVDCCRSQRVLTALEVILKVLLSFAQPI